MANSVTGVITLNGNPTDARATLVNTDTNTIVGSVTVTALSNGFAFGSLPAGKYEVIIFKSGYAPRVHGPWVLDGVPDSFVFRYWRLHFTANNGDGSYLSIPEIEMALTPGGADACAVATSSAAPVLASSEANSSNAAWMAFDGNLPSNKWTSNRPPSVGVPQWIRYDFGAGNDKEIREVRIAGPISGQLPMAPKDFTVQGSSDGSSWTTVSTHTNITGWAVTTYKTFAVQ